MRERMMHELAIAKVALDAPLLLISPCRAATPGTNPTG